MSLVIKVIEAELMMHFQNVQNNQIYAVKF